MRFASLIFQRLTAHSVSDPFHSRYGQHLSAAEVNHLVQPSTAALEGVQDWLCDHGIPEDEFRYSPAKDWIQVALSVESVERLLDTNYSVFKHEDGTHLVRALQWSLPMHLHEHIETIQPTNSFMRPLNRRSTLMVASTGSNVEQYAVPTYDSRITAVEACNASLITPNCLRTLYGMRHITLQCPQTYDTSGTTDYTAQSTVKNQIALTNYLGETSNRSDISLFLTQYRPEAVPSSQNFTVTPISGAIDQQSPANASQLQQGTGLEGNLDAETILGIAYPTPLKVYNTAGSPPFNPDAATSSSNNNEPYLDWLQFVLNQTDLPQVISNSYGDDEQTVPMSYANAICKAFAQLGARGVTVLFSSGDNGVGAAGKCFSNDGRNASTFLPAFPASCVSSLSPTCSLFPRKLIISKPYVTTVGGTKEISPEVVAYNPLNNYASGGGFSNYFARPAYQDSVVPAYVDSIAGQFEGMYNSSGRAYPDISAQGFHFATIWNGSLAVLDGTRYVLLLFSLPTPALPLHQAKSVMRGAEADVRAKQRIGTNSSRYHRASQRRYDRSWQASPGVHEPLALLCWLQGLHRCYEWKCDRV